MSTFSGTIKLKEHAQKKKKKLLMIFIVSFKHDISITLSWQRSLSYRNQSIDLLCKSIGWFLYDRDLRHEKVSKCFKKSTISFNIWLTIIFPCQNSVKPFLKWLSGFDNLRNTEEFAVLWLLWNMEIFSNCLELP